MVSELFRRANESLTMCNRLIGPICCSICMNRIGMAFLDNKGGLHHREIPPLAAIAERNGFDSIWFAEGLGGDAFCLATECALETNRIMLGTGITSVFTRSPTIISMAAATVSSISSGRFILGLGSSHKVQVQGEHGIDYSQPLERVKETIEIARKSVKDKRISYSGDIFKIDGFEFWFDQYPIPFPIYVGAVNPKLLRLAGQLADGIILVNSGSERVKLALEQVSQGAKEVGRDPTSVDIAAFLDCCISEHSDVAREAMKKRLVARIGYFPRYNKLVAEQGFERDALAVRQQFLAGNSEGAAKSISDDLVDSLVVAGTPKECRQQVRRFVDWGVRLPIVIPYPVDESTRMAVERCVETFSVSRSANG